MVVDSVGVDHVLAVGRPALGKPVSEPPSRISRHPTSRAIPHLSRHQDPAWGLPLITCLLPTDPSKYTAKPVSQKLLGPQAAATREEQVKPRNPAQTLARVIAMGACFDNSPPPKPTYPHFSRGCQWRLRRSNHLSNLLDTLAARQDPFA